MNETTAMRPPTTAASVVFAPDASISGWSPTAPIGGSSYVPAAGGAYDGTNGPIENVYGAGSPASALPATFAAAARPVAPRSTTARAAAMAVRFTKPASE